MSERFEESELLVSSSDRGVRLSVRGHIDLASVPTLRDALQRVLDGATGDVAVDLSQTGFCDSAGLHALLAGQRRLEAAGRTMRLVNPPSCVIRLLQLTATTELFHLATEPGPAADLGVGRAAEEPGSAG